MNFTSDEEKLSFKLEIKEACISVLSQRINNAQSAMQLAQESANSEEKSSAGDKHETSRSMSQLDSEMNARQLAQAQRELEALGKLNTDTLYSKVGPGAVCIAGEHIFFIGIGLGNITIGDAQVIVLSPQAPLAMQLLHKQAGGQFTFKGRSVTIDIVF